MSSLLLTCFKMKNEMIMNFVTRINVHDKLISNIGIVFDALNEVHFRKLGEPFKTD
jgi:hypothetical protein